MVLLEDLYLVVLVVVEVTSTKAELLELQGKEMLADLLLTTLEYTVLVLVVELLLLERLTMETMVALAEQDLTGRH